VIVKREEKQTYPELGGHCARMTRCLPKVKTGMTFRPSFSAGNHGTRGHSLAIKKEDIGWICWEVGGDISSGYPLPLHWNESLGIGIPVRRFTAMMDLATTF